MKSPNNFNYLLVHTEDFMVICAYILYVPIVQYCNPDIHIYTPTCISFNQ